MAAENVVSKGLVDLRGALLGPQMEALFLEVSGGNVLNVHLGRGGIVLAGEIGLDGFSKEGRIAMAMVRGDSASVGVLRTREDAKLFTGRGLLEHPDKIVAVQSGFFDEQGDSISDKMIRDGKMDSVRHLVGISGFVGSRVSADHDLYRVVADRARELMKSEIAESYIFNKE